MTKKRESIDEYVRKPQPGNTPRIGDTLPPKSKPKSISTLAVDVSVDVSDGIKALKALQREAKSTIKLLKEVEESSKTLSGIDSHETLNNVEKIAKAIQRSMIENIRMT